MNIGIAARKSIKKLLNDENARVGIHQFYLNVLEYYRGQATQIKYYFQLNDPVFDFIQIVDPDPRG